MTILDPEPKAMLSAIMEVALIETGNRATRERWQQAQFRNLIKHATKRSAFWRSRIDDTRHSEIELTAVPILTRQDLRKQVVTEGSLLRPADGIETGINETSGSSGIPVRFFTSRFNTRYNVIRSIAQYFLEGRDFSLNRTRVRLASAPLANGISVNIEPSWIGSLSPIIRSGVNKHIEYHDLNEKEICGRLVEELKKDAIGYLICPPRVMETLSSLFDLGFLKEAKLAIWIAFSETIEPHLLNVFADQGIPIRQNYSAEEVGMIGAECNKMPGYFHVATSNVMVETVEQKYQLNGSKIGKVLITHLHSYATPFIRYDLGDLACLRGRCPCGHEGQTIYNLHGRLSRVIKHRDGRVSPLYISVKDLSELAELTEYRMRQTAFDRIVVEIGGRSALRDEEVDAITAFLKQRVGQEFKIEVKARKEIDWGQSRKRYGFRCEI